MFIVILFLLLASSYAPIFAGNGILPLGYSIKALGMGGVITAYPQDSLAATYNPAGMLAVGTRIDISGKFVVPPRGYKYSGSPLFEGDTIKSNKNFFFVPQGGFNICLGKRSSLGASVYMNGMNADYPKPNPAFGTSKLKADIKQYFFAPTYAYHLACNQNVGISAIIATQSIKLNGLERFANPILSESPENVTNNGTDRVWGAGIRVGWYGTLFKYFKCGAAYSTKIFSQKTKKYAGLIANNGCVDIPAIFNAGAAFDCKGLALAFDYVLIFYNSVPTLGNSIAQIGLPINPADIINKLGSKNGPGFGWRNLSVYKWGAAYTFKECMTARAGFSVSKVPYPPLEIDFNILGTATVKDHITVGFTYIMHEHHEFDVAYAYGIYNTRKGESQLELGTVKEHQMQHILGLNYGFKF